MKYYGFLFGAAVSMLMLSNFWQPALSHAEDKPNLVLIYADDIGFGDVGCYGATAVATPNIDRLAKAGIRFTDAHSAAATCTPSRFAMLTGLYAWRQEGTGIARGDAASIISPGTTTLASIFQEAGYKSSVVGKWHLGLGSGQLNWNERIAPGPLELGFDECFIMPATGDRMPVVYVENDRVANLDPADPISVSFDKPIGDEPTGAKNPELLRQSLSHGHDNTIHNGVSRIGFMSGGKSARWIDEDMADTFTTKACDFIDRQGKAEQPFFLFLSLHDIHVPRLPHKRFVGTTKMGPRGDAIAQTDWCVGEVLKQLESNGIVENTLVVFSSDNGPVLDDGYNDDAVKKLGKHDPAGGFRGGKYSAYEAGTRVPMVARWPAKIPAGKVSSALMCQIDFCASIASILGLTLHPEECQDSREHVSALFGEDERGRWFLVEQSKTLSLRHGEWKYIQPTDGPSKLAATNTESGFSKSPQLYNLNEDPKERNDLAKKYPKKIEEYEVIMKRLRNEVQLKR